MRCCEACGAELVRHPKHSRRQWESKRFCNHACVALANRKPRSCQCGCGQRTLPGRKYIKGHRPLKLTTQGYRRIWVGRDHPCADGIGMALEHRVVLFDAGIPVPPGFQVHHCNGVKTDNRLVNLEVISASEHARRHAQERGTITNQFGTFPLRRMVA